MFKYDRGVIVHVTLLSNLSNSVAVQGELGLYKTGSELVWAGSERNPLTFSTGLKNGIKLAMHQYIGISTNGRGKVCVERD